MPCLPTPHAMLPACALTLLPPPAVLQRSPSCTWRASWWATPTCTLWSRCVVQGMAGAAWRLGETLRLWQALLAVRSHVMLAHDPLLSPTKPHPCFTNSLLPIHTPPPPCRSRWRRPRCRSTCSSSRSTRSSCRKRPTCRCPTATTTTSPSRAADMIVAVQHCGAGRCRRPAGQGLLAAAPAKAVADQCLPGEPPAVQSGALRRTGRLSRCSRQLEACLSSFSLASSPSRFCFLPSST